MNHLEVRCGYVEECYASYGWRINIKPISNKERILIEHYYPHNKVQKNSISGPRTEKSKIALIPNIQG